MSCFANIDGSLRASVTGFNPGATLPYDTLMIQLADEDEWLEQKVRGFRRVIIRYHGLDHEFTPGQVLAALDAAKVVRGTCKNTSKDGFKCSECGDSWLGGFHLGAIAFKRCPSCGRKVVK